ncbi:MAG: type II toxin-antitoxin system RelE/ParE family toxin [Deltaproteobacteria bacterium]|nr:type II toxin-antitoxin system RelE/ParE family toxin [Deltaproteobacteria bacterium]
MDSYKVKIKPSAVKELKHLPKKDLKRAVSKIRGLANNPRPEGCIKLSGSEKYRIRQGNYRIVYSIQDDVLVVVVVKVAHRKEAYR